MSLGTFLRARPILTARRSPAPSRRALLELDAGDALTPASYPYPPGSRAIAPFVARILNPGRGRARAQLFPPAAGLAQRTFANLDYPGRRAADRAATRDVSGLRVPAKGSRVRPWLFAGGSSATSADRMAATLAAGSSAGTGSGGCEGCG